MAVVMGGESVMAGTERRDPTSCVSAFAESASAKQETKGKIINASCSTCKSMCYQSDQDHVLAAFYLVSNHLRAPCKTCLLGLFSRMCLGCKEIKGITSWRRSCV